MEVGIISCKYSNRPITLKLVSKYLPIEIPISQSRYLRIIRRYPFHRARQQFVGSFEKTISHYGENYTLIVAPIILVKKISKIVPVAHAYGCRTGRRLSRQKREALIFKHHEWNVKSNDSHLSILRLVVNLQFTYKFCPQGCNYR